MRRRMVPMVLAAALIGGGVTLAGVPAASAAPVCAVVWTANQWATGFTADVQVTNGGAPVTSWTLSWTFAGNQRVTSGWNATVTQSGAVVTAASTAWNGTLATGAATRFGFQGTYSGTNVAPTAFTFNGVPCGGDTPGPTPSTTSASPTPSATSASPTPSASTPVPPVPGCGTAVVCDGFETQTGSVPGGAWTVSHPDCSGAGTAAVDRTVAHGGSTSLRINGAAGYCNHVFAGTSLPATAGPVWHVRYWVRHTTALPASHVTTVAMRDSADGNRDLRFGGQNGALQFNRASDDATLPEQSPAGVALSAPLPVNTWNCVEFKVDGRAGTIETWLNGTAVPGLSADGVPTHDIDGQWLNRTWRPAPTDLRLGWESYGEGADTLWYDDVAAGAARHGC